MSAMTTETLRKDEPAKGEPEKRGAAKKQSSEDYKAPIYELDGRLWRSWQLLAVVAVIATFGLATTTSSLMWPWEGMELIPLGGLAIVILAFVAHLTRMYKSIISEREFVQDAERDFADERYKRIFELLNVGHILDSDSETQGVFDGVTKLCMEVFDCQKASLMLPDNEGLSLEVQSAVGYSNPKAVGARQRIGQGISGWVAENRRPVLLTEASDASQYPGLTFEKRGILSAMVMPILVRDELIGVISISTQSKDVTYNDNDLQAFRAFADTVGTYIVHINKTRTMMQTIKDQQTALQEKYLQV